MLSLWLITFLLEGALYGLDFLWRLRRVLAPFIGLLITVASVGISLQVTPTATVLLLLLALYRVGNLLRVVKARMHPHYLRRSVGRSAFWLLMFHIFGTPMLLVVSYYPFLFNVLAVLQAVVAAGILCITFKNIAKLRFKMPDTYLTDRELPTVTVAIPARNETYDLEACLRSVLASDYPKLEVIVLDDCSQAKTADTIRSFAHDGVRFVRGEEPAERWLAKNQAYQKLYEEASGDLVLFCGVDVRFGASAIRSMVNLIYSRNKSMLSVLPVRTASSPAVALIQPMRYWWELSLPRRLLNRPAVLSTCWMIGREDLSRLGGFAAVSHAILPETFFARELIKADQYSFVRSSGELEVQTAKSFSEQYHTVIRTRYPQLRRRPEAMLLLTSFYALFLLLPFLFLALSFWLHSAVAIVLLVACLLLVANHVAIVAVTDPANTITAAVSFIFVVLTELSVCYSSMLQYEFFTVEWKDRNICIPVMHAIPNLPKLQ